MSAGFRGASASQDSRFSNKEKKLLKTMSFPEELSSPVDISKVNLESMQPWIVKRTTEILKIEDDVVVGLLVNLLEEKVDPKMIQIQLTPFLEGNTSAFMTVRRFASPPRKCVRERERGREALVARRRFVCSRGSVSLSHCFSLTC